jgi:hypothetical protein
LRLNHPEARTVAALMGLGTSIGTEDHVLPDRAAAFVMRRQLLTSARETRPA